MLTQLFGDHMMVSNATGCSSIYGGNLPTTPWSTNKQGRGPSWANSLFEDNAEFGFGMRLAVDKFNEQALELLRRVPELEHATELVESLLNADQSTQEGVDAQRAQVEVLRKALEGASSPEAKRLLELSEYLVRRVLWIVGGDGWAYDIGFGGLDHVLASGRNVNILVLDTEVYSNTGGQSSKSTPTGAVAKFANSGKATAKKDLARMAMSYGHVYVATVAYGANDAQTVRALTEAAKYDGPSLVIAYSPCIAHGLDMARQPEQQDRAVKSGHWPLFRFNPALAAEGKNPFALDSKSPSIPFKEYAYAEARYRMLAQAEPERAEALLKQAETGIAKRWDYLSDLANPS
jgi:pyruvate-ferredoxin/flavodoxin oxidoreductase